MKTSATIDELIKEWLSDLDISAASRASYKFRLSYWFRFLDQFSINKYEPQRKDLIKYKDHLKMNKSLFTINAYVTTVKLFYQWCSKMGYYDYIGWGIRSSTVQKFHNRRSLSKEESDALVQSLDLTTKIGKRDYIIIGLMLTSGLRACEVANINLNDITETDISIQRKGRINKDSVVSLNHNVYNVIQEYIEDRKILSKNEPLFISESNRRTDEHLRLKTTTICRLVKNRMIKAGLHMNKISAHSLRHTFADFMIDNGVSIQNVQKMMGHSNISTTEIYVIDARERSLRKGNVINKLGDKLLLK